MVQYVNKKKVIKVFDDVLENLDMDKEEMVEMSEVYDTILLIKNEIEKM
jgi:hypothetical protein